MSDKRERILQAVLEIFMEEGVGNLKVSKIASRADVGKGTVYEYFRSKEDMFIGAVEHGLSLMAGMMEEKLSDSVGFRESFDSMVECMFEIISKGPFISLATNPGSMPFTAKTLERIKDVIKKASVSFVSLMEEIIQKGVDEGILKEPSSSLYTRAVLLIITNMTVQEIHNGKPDMESMKTFYYDACIKLLS